MEFDSSKRKLELLAWRATSVLFRLLDELLLKKINTVNLA